MATCLKGYAELIAMFDQYRLRTVIFKTRPILSPDTAATTQLQQWCPDITVSVDHTSQTPPTTVDALRQYAKAKSGILKHDRWFTYKCHPTLETMIYGSPTVQAFGPAKNATWINCDTDAAYYGLKYAYDAAAYGNTQTSGWAFERRLVCVWEFRSTK